MISERREGGMLLRIFETREEAGGAAAEAAAKAVRELLLEKETVNMIFAAAPSQNEMLEAFAASGVDFGRIRAFHMDEYLGLPPEAPQRFGRYLEDHIFGKVSFLEVYYLGSRGAGLDADEGAGTGAGIGAETGAGIGAGTGAGLGADEGAGLGAGTGAGLGAGTGAETGADEGAGTGAGLGADEGAGTGAGLDAGTGAGLGAGTGAGLGAGTGAGLGADEGAGTGAGLGAGTRTGAGLDAGTGAGLGADDECRRYSELLRRYPVDITLMGIGENGHIAFNDPHEARFDDPELVRRVTLDARCRQQQVNDGCFERLELVPEEAMTLTIPALMAAKTVICTVPGRTKREAVRRTVTGPVSEECPASIMRRGNNSMLFCDRESAADLL